MIKTSMLFLLWFPYVLWIISMIFPYLTIAICLIILSFFFDDAKRGKRLGVDYIKGNLILNDMQVIQLRGNFLKT